MTIGIRPEDVSWPPPCRISVISGSEVGFIVREAFDSAPDQWISLGACETAFDANNFAMQRNLAVGTIRQAFGMTPSCDLLLLEE